MQMHRVLLRTYEEEGEKKKKLIFKQLNNNSALCFILLYDEINGWSEEHVSSRLEVFLESKCLKHSFRQIGKSFILL